MATTADIFPAHRRPSQGDRRLAPAHRPSITRTKWSSALPQASVEDHRPSTAPPAAAETSSMAVLQPAVATDKPALRSTKSSSSVKRLSKLFTRSPSLSSPSLLLDDDASSSPTVSLKGVPVTIAKESRGLDSPTWQSLLSQNEFDSVLAAHGTREVLRQELIHELCDTERAFVKSMKDLKKLFVSPLKNVNGQWVRGVPYNVSRFFDCLDDVAAVHVDLARAFDKARARAGGKERVVPDIAAAFEPFVERFETYLPYLATFEATTADLERRSADAQDTFGEFVRLQSSSPLCGGLSLASWLLKPVQRLMKYPLFLRQLRDATEKGHREHDEITKLFDATDTMIKALQEVKTREDEYARLQELVIAGLPVKFRLAVRDRKLLWQGAVSRVQTDEGPMSAASYASEVMRKAAVRSSSDSLTLSQTNSSSPSSRRSSTDAFVLGGAVSGSKRMSVVSTGTGEMGERRKSVVRALKMPRLRSSAGQDGYAFIFDDLVIFAQPSTTGSPYVLASGGFHGRPLLISEAASDGTIKLECSSVTSELRLARDTTTVSFAVQSTTAREALLIAVRASMYKRRSIQPRLSTFGLVRSPSEIGKERASLGPEELARQGPKLDKEERVFWSFRLEHVRRESALY